MESSFSSDLCQARIVINKYSVHITGHLTGSLSAAKEVEYLAASPADFRQSYTGSGLPFGNPKMAFEGSQNNGVVAIDHTGAFHIQLEVPNSYYTDLMGTLQGPEVLLMADSTVVRIPITAPIPYRSLTYPHEHVEQGPEFYESGWRMPVRTQEQILRDSGYGRNKTFWGLKPPV